MPTGRGIWEDFTICGPWEFSWVVNTRHWGLGIEVESYPNHLLLSFRVGPLHAWVKWQRICQGEP